MRLVETDDASLFIDPSAENLPGLAEQAQPPPYAASPSPTRSLFNHDGLTWNPVTTAENDDAAAAAAALTESEMSKEGKMTSVVHHLQTDSDNHSVNTDCDLLLDMAGGMMMSPPRPRPRMNFSGEEALFLMPDFHTDMGGGMMSMSPSRMNYFSPPSGDSDPFRWWNFADDSEVQELENRKEMMIKPTWKQPCIEEVDPVSGSGLGRNESLGIWAAALEAENMGGTVQTQRSDDHSLNNLDERFQLAGGMNYSLASVDDSLPLGRGRSFEPYRFLDDRAYSVGHELYDRLRSMRATISWIAVDSELLSHKELWLNIGVQAMEKGLPVADTDVNCFCKFKCTTLSLIEVEMGMRGTLIEQDSFTDSLRCGEYGVHSITALEFLKKEFVDTSNSSEMASLELEHQISFKRQLLDDLERIVAELKNIVHLERVLAKLEKIVLNLDRLLYELEEIVVNLERLVAELEKIVVNLERLVDVLKEIVKLDIERFVAELEKIVLNLERHVDEFEETVVNLEILAAELKKSHTVRILAAVLEAECGMMQLDSPCEPNNSIDAKGGNSRCRWEKDHGINRQVLQQLFGKSRDTAAKTLKVSTSTLKRACRHFGITRWPNHSKGKMPNCSLNQKQHVQAAKKHKGIQPCLALPPLQATDTSQCNSTISVKVIYKNDTLRFPLSSSSTMKYLEEQLETKLKISLENFSIKYQDEEDEWITLTCDSELLHGLDVLRSCGKTVIRMMVTPKFN